ncbi:cutinase family protein [Rhodococcus sp. NPDC055024]
MLRRTVFDHRLSWLVAAVIAILVVSGIGMPSGVTARANADPVTTSTTATVPASTALVAGGDHACALLAGGTAKCWGNNGWGQLGDGTTTDRLTPVDVVGISGATALTAGRGQTCALMSGGTAKCWGYNESGQLGDGTTTQRSTPVDVVGISGATALTARASQTCALMSGGTAKCWGHNEYGQLGDGTTAQRSTPVNVVGISGATALTAGNIHTCALMSGGTAKCWGDNGYGQLGDGTSTQRSTPVEVVGLSGATALTAGGSQTCAVLSGGTAKCWGHNGWRQLGDGTSTSRSTPVDVVGISGATALAAGNIHTCAVMPGGIAKCWGYNESGQLGDGTTTQRSTPVDVVGISGATALTAGFFYTCAVMSGGTAKCWGYNGYGQLGDGTTSPSRSTPVEVVGLAGIIDPGAPGNPDPQPVSEGCAGTTYFFGVRGSGETPQLDPVAGGDRTGSFPSGTAFTYLTDRDLFYNTDRPHSGMGEPVGEVARVIGIGASNSGGIIPLGLAYPAVDVDIASWSYNEDYRSSVDLGARRLRTVLRLLDASCGDANLPHVVLSGYSQGAHVVEDALALINNEDPQLAVMIRKVVLLGSPVHRASGPENVGGARTAGALIHTRKAGTNAFLDAHPGVVESICRTGDIVCDASYADGLSDPTTFLGTNLGNSLGKRVHTSYVLSDIACPYTALQQNTIFCGANAVLQKFGWPMYMGSTNGHGSSTDTDLQYHTRPGQKIDFFSPMRKSITTVTSKILNLRMYSTPIDLGTFEINDDGIAVGSFTIPENTPPGQHTLVFRRGDGETFTRSIIVEPSGDGTAESLLLTIDGDAPDPQPYPEDPDTPHPPDPETGSGSGSTGSLFGS